MLRTSLSHPLRIDTVRAPGGGRIGLTLCPGKRQMAAETGSWHRDLSQDITIIAEWGAQVVVTLMEHHELRMLGVSHLPAALEARGLEWCHLPIRDGGVPNRTFEERWSYEGFGLRDILRRRGQILLHCKGGLGRTGTVAARLLVEMGMESEAAIGAVRAARTGAIETQAQADHVRKCRPLVR